MLTRAADLKTIESVFAADIYYHGNCVRAYERKYERISESFDGLTTDNSGPSDCKISVLRANAMSQIINRLKPRIDPLR